MQGEYLAMANGINEMLDSIINPMNLASAYLESISQGEIPPKITETYTGDFEGVKTSINGCIDAVGSLLSDTTSLAQSAVAGRLDKRADPSRHVGDFRRIIEGMNQTLDSLLAPIREATAVLERLANRDLSARVDGEFPGEHAKLKDAVNQTADALDRTLGQVAQAVEQITAAASQIAVGSQSVAQGAAEQASALEETSSSMEQMAGMTQQNAEHTQQARTLADTTRQAAEKGVNAMTHMVQSIGKIRSSSEGTAVIIRDINDIAFQTNLLALNAAVEAARAGDAGRGFAVVAEEVRNLAGRAKDAARKTDELIGQSVRLTEEGQAVSQQVDAGLRAINDSAIKVFGIVGEIAAASREQTKGILQVNKALAEMDKITQQNAANSEQSSSAAEQLAGQAEALAAILSEFGLTSATYDDEEEREPAPRLRASRTVASRGNGGSKQAANPRRTVRA